MSSEPLKEKVRILDKEYLIACQEDEREGLRESARMLDGKMREIRSGGKVVGSDRVAVMAGLNIAYELLQERGNDSRGNAAINDRLRRLQDRIDLALRDDDPQLKL